MLDFLLTRYAGNIHYVLEMPLFKGLELVTRAVEAYKEEKAFQIWTTLQPWMTKENYLTFSEFIEKMKTPRKPEKTREAILDEARAIRDRIFIPSKKGGKG